MLIFIVPLQSPQVSKSWKRVSKLACRTIASITNQSHPDFRIILVCNQKPIGLDSHPALDVIECDLPPPPNVHGDKERDKWTKLRIGLAVGRRYAPAHFMLLDADDCVNRDLAALSAAHPDGHGWYMDRGYVHREGSPWVVLKNQFHHLCGSSAIVLCDVADLPKNGDDDSRTLTRCGHGVIVDERRRLRRPLSPLPFVGTVYITGTSENHSGLRYGPFDSIRRFLGEITRYRLLTQGLRTQFSLSRIN